MSKFQFWLGWTAVILSIGAVIIAVLSITVWHESSVVLIRLIWLPFVFLWGLRQIRIYNYHKKIGLMSGK
jgi:hypothetical protein